MNVDVILHELNYSGQSVRSEPTWHEELANLSLASATGAMKPQTVEGKDQMQYAARSQRNSAGGGQETARFQAQTCEMLIAYGSRCLR
ncbi:MAG: hypothetical protein DDT39_00361 [Firmicutes bacterium]|nr:hypothetical protein [candidate division NPL-UPA2 bacterium]